MKRETQIKAIKRKSRYDMLVIGGGATGLGIAVDAITRGLSVLLVEQYDFSKATSSRSTKLVHGGVRYLAQGDVQLVIHALHERGRMKRNVSHLVKDMRFIIGGYRWWEKAFYSMGLTLYDILAGRLGLGRSLPLSRERVIREIPAIKQKGLRGGIVYHDGQFDDARMAITLAQTAIDYGAVCINYMKVDNLLKNNGTVCGAVMTDQLTNEIYTIEAKSVINATGVFVDEIMKMVGQEAEKKIRPSQGVHLVVDSKFLGGDSALMIPKTKDGRVLFGVPWHGKVVLGTTDTPLAEASVEPRALDEEIDFILDQAGEYLDSKPTRKDVRSVFAGLRPLAASVKSNGQKTKEISRSHKIYKSPCGRLITITGGKWTTYREMAEDAVNQAVKNANLICRPCMTKELKQHGYTKNVDRNFWDYVYGSDVKYIKKLTEEDASNADLLYEGFTFTKAHVVWAVREEMAVTVEDILARRVRLLFLDAKAAMKVAPAVASIIAKETGKDKTWEEEQVKEFIALAEEYVLS